MSAKTIYNITLISLIFIFLCRIIALPAGLGGFVLVKKLVDKQRKEDLKALQKLERSK